MDKLLLNDIDRRDELDADTFIREYFKKNKPVIFRTFAKDWPALQKWNYDYFKTQQGHIDIPIQSEAFANSDTGYLSAHAHMKFADYLDLISTTPTRKRLFAYNIFKSIPSLCEDFFYPAWKIPFLKRFPFVFFGGATSFVDVHYDVDLSHVFLTQFTGTKQVTLFAPHYSTQLYRHPWTVASNVDIGHPDFITYPQLREVRGSFGTLEHGDTLFIPSGYWHYIYYKTGGFSLALRSRTHSRWTFLRGLCNLFKLGIIDRFFSKWYGNKKWYQKKETMAHKRAEKFSKPT